MSSRPQASRSSAPRPGLVLWPTTANPSRPTPRNPCRPRTDRGTEDLVPVEAIEFDPFSDTFFDDPYDTYARLRDEAPVYFNEAYGFYAVSRYSDVVAVHADPERFVSSYGVTLEMLRHKRPMGTNMMIVMDPPEHTRQRRLVSQAFSRRAIGSLEPLVAA